MTLIEKFALRIDSDKGYDNLKLAKDLAMIVEAHQLGKTVDEHEEYEKYKAICFEAFKRVNEVAPGIGSWGFGKSSEITRREARKGAKHFVSQGVISETDYKLAVLGEKEAVKWLREQEK